MLNIINHALITEKLSVMRDEKTPDEVFKTKLEEISFFVASYVYEKLPLSNMGEILTPTNSKFTKLGVTTPVTLMPILRAGKGMVKGFIDLNPSVHVADIGLKRNEKTLKPDIYSLTLPEDKNGIVIVIDPMLATGGSAIFALQTLIEKGYNNLVFVSLIASEKGAENVLKAFPNLEVYTCAVDKTLNSDGYIVPGLGDAGDRLFGPNIRDIKK